MALKIPPRQLRDFLEEIHSDFVKNNEVSNDAIAPALYYSSPRDQEFVAFICAILAYGKIAQVQKSVAALMEPFGPEPVEYIISLKPPEIWECIRGWRHRFNTDKDVYSLLLMLRKAYAQHVSLESFIGINQEDSAFEVLEKLVEKLTVPNVSDSWDPRELNRSFWHMLPRPSSGSACKRLNLFLRWMVGKSDMDLSLWGSMQRRNLIVPLDTHVMKQSQILGLTQRKSADWKTAEEVTGALKLLDPEDPTRFDFALCHLSINKVDLLGKAGR